MTLRERIVFTEVAVRLVIAFLFFYAVHLSRLRGSLACFGWLSWAHREKEPLFFFCGLAVYGIAGIYCTAAAYRCYTIL